MIEYNQQTIHEMSKLKKQLFERINILIGGLLAFFGIGVLGCSTPKDVKTAVNTIDTHSIDEQESIPNMPKPIIEQVSSEEDVPVCKYGVPMAQFHIQGFVSDSKTGKGLDHISVEFDMSDRVEQIVTDDSGNYDFEMSVTFPSDSVVVSFKDMESRYEEYQVSEAVKLENGTDEWDLGSANLRVDAKLKRGEKE